MSRPAHANLLLAAAAALLAIAALTLPAASAQAQTKAQKQAAELAGQARESFGNGDYEQAATLLQQAFDAFPEPNFIWNKARAYELAGLYEQAGEAYWTFSQLEVSEDERGAAIDRASRIAAWRDMPDALHAAQDGAELETLRKSVKTLRSGAPLPVATTEGSEISPTLLGGWVGAGLGLTCLGTAGILHLASIGTVEEYNAAAANGEVNKYTALKDTLNTRVVSSQVLLISGVVLTGVGGTLLYFEYFDTPSDAAPAATLEIAPLLDDQNVGLGFSGRF